MISVPRPRRLRGGRVPGQDDPGGQETLPEEDVLRWWERAFGRGGSRLKRVAAAATRPLGMALFQGDADPPPRSRRLTFRTPRRLRPAIPFGSFSLVQVADVVLALVTFGQTVSLILAWNAEAARAHALNPVLAGPVSDLFAYLTAIGTSLPIALRDRWPLAAWRLAAMLLPVGVWVWTTVGDIRPPAATPAFSDYGPPYIFPTVLMYLLVVYSVAVRCDRRITLGIWFITVVAAWIIHPDSMAVVTVAVSVAMLFGYNVRMRRSATARLLEEERRSREAESAQAVLEERARIARELHDVVAHHMSVIAIQAEAVPLKARGDPAQLEAGLAEIRGLSLEAIAELRQVLGVLRDQDGRADTAPQPGLDRLEELLSNARAAGLAVLVERSGPIGLLPPAVGLSAYRIVQESLSNAMRHAPGATVTLDITRMRDQLRLRVANGPGTAPGSAPGGGQGLVGMRERAALLGGSLAAGPVESGGFEICATLPLTDDVENEQEAAP
ncbi:sensor histidine kinase [Nonomuraea sp. NPDC049695]|uniref:sensor histidine kinase n=1 Tax=Nonomuraea sp. NPDC049695 TaxID=3154734 RepID=UPI0034367526